MFNSGFGNFLLSLFWFTMVFMWIWIWISIIADIFRSDDLSGWGKALWCIFTVFLPFLGVFVYLIARGKHMAENNRRTYKAAQDAQADYIRSVAAPSSATGSAEELERLAKLRDSGVLSQAEFDQAKAKTLA